MEKISEKISPQGNEYLADILKQPAALRKGLAALDVARLDPLVQALRGDAIRQVVLTGMGSSLAALYPAWLHLLAAGIEAIWLDTAELLHFAPQLLGDDALLWVASQSGRSAEIVALVEQVTEIASDGRSLAALLAFTNEVESPLAEGTLRFSRGRPGLLLPLNAGPEFSVSTRTYMNTLAMAQVVARVLGGMGNAAEPERVKGELEQFAGDLEAYLTGWALRLDEIAAAIGPSVERLALVGRGPSMAAVSEGALSIMESAKFPVLAMEAAQFRHGPLEMAGPRFTALVFAGEGQVRTLNRRLCDDLRQKGANALWLDGMVAVDQTRLANDQGTIRLPVAAGAALPLAEIVPVQLLCLHLSVEQGYVPGTYRWVGKVTGQE